MLENYGLDRLIAYGTEPLPDTTRVVNPAWRKLDGQVRKQVALLSKAQAQFGAVQLAELATPQEAANHALHKGEILRAVQDRQVQVSTLKAARKASPKHVMIKELPEEDRFCLWRSKTDPVWRSKTDPPWLVFL